jgi:hypothetical protein
MRIKHIITEGYTVVRPIDKEKYQARDGLEGPFQLRNGKVVYYDPREGSYYDPDSDMYISYDDYKQMDQPSLSKANENQTSGQFQEYDVFKVNIPANVYDGKYYDYRTVGYTVFKGMDGVETAQDAVNWVNTHRDQVLADLEGRRIASGSRKIRLVANPAEKNVFFKNTYTVKPHKLHRVTDAPAKANFDPAHIQSVGEADLQVHEDKSQRNRNRLMAIAADYEQRAANTQNPIKQDHFMRMADEARSKILADQPVVQQGMAEDDVRPSYVVSTRDRPKKIKPSMGGESPHPYQGKLVGATENFQKAVKNREASRKRAIARAAADLRASGGKKSVAELIKFYELFPNDAEKIQQLASAQKESVAVNSTQYQFAHGKPPKGYGSWFFTRNRRGVDFRKDELNKDYIQVSMMSYADAKRAAQQWAKEKGYDMIYVAENAQHIDEVAHELGLQDHEPRVIKGVRGLKSSNFTKKFPNHAAQERWMNQNPDYEVRQVQRESATSPKDKNQSETQVASWGSSKVIHAHDKDRAFSLMLSLQNQNDLAKLSDGDYTEITDELGEKLTVSRKNQQFTLSTADGKASVTVDAADIISLYAR